MQLKKVYRNWSVCASISTGRWPSVGPSYSVMLLSSSSSLSSFALRFRAAATRTWTTDVRGLPRGCLYLYRDAPKKNTTMARIITAAGIPNPHPKPTLSCIIKSQRQAQVMKVYTNLKPPNHCVNRNHRKLHSLR